MLPYTPSTSRAFILCRGGGRIHRNWIGSLGREPVSMEHESISSKNRIEIPPDSPCPCGSNNRMEDCCMTPDGRFQPPLCNTQPPLPITGYSHPSCYAASLGDCSPSISREHYISAGLLHRLRKDPGGMIRVSGLAWAKDEKRVSVNSLASKILCERHNNALSPLDSIGVRIFDTIARIKSDFALRQDHDQAFLFNGHDVERWLLKTLCGIAMSGGLLDANRERSDWKPDLPLLEMLFGLRSLPANCGLRCGAFEPGDHDERNIEFTPHISSDKKKLLATSFRMFPIRFILVLEYPFEGMDIILPELQHHPELVVFRAGDGKKVIMFRWNDSSPVQ